MGTIIDMIFTFITTLCHFENPGSFASLFLLFSPNKIHGRQQTESFILLYTKNGYSINQWKLRHVSLPCKSFTGNIWLESGLNCFVSKLYLTSSVTLFIFARIPISYCVQGNLKRENKIVKYFTKKFFFTKTAIQNCSWN